MDFTLTTKGCYNEDPFESMPEESPKSKRPIKRDQGLIVRSELNLEQYSIFTVSTYRKKSREITIKEKFPTGEIIERKAIIGKTAGGVETGVLDIYHFKIYLALLELWEKAGRPIPPNKVPFTILRIINELNLSYNGRTYARVKRWLLDLSQIPLTFIDSFFDARDSFYRSTKPFPILDYLEIYERKKTGQNQKIYGYGEFRFHEYILKNLINNYSHPLRLDVVKEFKEHKDLAILLYTYLDRNLAFKDKYEIRLEPLFEHLDLRQEYIPWPAKRKQRLAPVLKELEGKELSTGILTYCQIEKIEDKKDYKLVAKKKPLQRLAVREPLPIQSELIAELKSKGLTESQTRELLNFWDEGTIKKQLEIFPFKLKWYKDKGLKVKNPSALLYMMIKGNWVPPPNYLEAKEREERGKRAKHYILWSCRNLNCEYQQKVVLTPKEKGQPKICPKCGSPVEILNTDFKEYQEG